MNALRPAETNRDQSHHFAPSSKTETAETCSLRSGGEGLAPHAHALGSPDGSSRCSPLSNGHNVTHRALSLRARIPQLQRMNTLKPLEIEPKPAETRRVTKRVRHAIDFMISGQCKTQKDAAEKAGLSRERFCRALKEGHVQAYLGEQTRVLLGQSQAPAAATLMTLLEQAKSEHVRKDVATTLLSINGIGASERGPVVNVGVNVGWVIDLREPHERNGPLVDVTPAVRP